MNIRPAIISFLLIFTSCLLASAQDSYEGTITYRSGQQVKFNALGTLKKRVDYKLEGKLGDQKVELLFSELSEIVFSDKEKYYAMVAGPNGAGEAIVVNKEGKRFTIHEARVTNLLSVGWAEFRLAYTFNDPISGSQKESKEVIKGNILSVSIGKSKGNVKRNPKTGEVFPAIYIFDPFTGDKLVWGKSEK